MSNLDLKTYFDESYINEFCEDRLTKQELTNIKREWSDIDNQPSILMNAIGFLNDFYENECEDDDEEIDDRRPIIKETIKQLCRWYLYENANLIRREKVRLNGGMM